MPRIKPEDRLIVSIPDYNGAGIYMIRNIVTGKLYIGSSNHIRNRIKEHDQYMRKGLCNNRFQEDIDKGHRFTCEVIEKYDSITLVELRDREEYYVREYDCYNSGYNTAIVPTYNIKYYAEGSNVYKWLTQNVNRKVLSCQESGNQKNTSISKDT